MDRKFGRKRDILLVASLLAAAGILWLETVPLSGPDREIVLSSRPHVHLRLENHAVAFTSSDCPDKTCIRAGYLSKPGQASACLPNGVVLKITGSGGTDITVG